VTSPTFRATDQVAEYDAFLWHPFGHEHLSSFEKKKEKKGVSEGP
jgi:hypothetical protein